MHGHEAVVAHHATAKFALDLKPGDIYWCTADPGWVTGTSYGVIAPLTTGATTVVDEAEFDAVFSERARPVEDPALYVCVPPDQAPEGQEAWFVLVNAPRHGTGKGAIDWRAPGRADSYADRLVDLPHQRGIAAAPLGRAVARPASVAAR